MKVTLRRKISGLQLIDELENTYGSLENLEKFYDDNLNNLKMYADLDNWKYYQNNLDEELEDGQTIDLDQLEWEILDLIYNNNGLTITKIVNKMNYDLSSIKYKLDKLMNYGLIVFKNENNSYILKFRLMTHSS